MTRRGYFIFGEVNSVDHDIYISAGNTYDSAVREYETISIPGRDGDLIVKSDRFSNYEMTYPAFTFADTRREFEEQIKNIRSALGSQSGYQRLWDSYNPDIYRLAMFKGRIAVDAAPFLKAGEFELLFNCKPQRYLLSGDEEVVYTASGMIFNPTLYNSKPLIKVTGYGTLGIGDYNVAITGSANTVTYIDCDAMEAYAISGGAKVSRNAYISTGNYFPEIEPGQNGISLANTISEAIIIPRWWEL